MLGKNKLKKKWRKGKSVKDAAISSSSNDDTKFLNDTLANSINSYTVDRSLMPDWYHPHPYIQSGYRRITNSFRGCFLSLFYIHNELGNIYSHLVGVFLYCFLFPTVSYWLPYPNTTPFEYLLFYLFCFGSLTCFLTSTLFHLCGCHSKSVFIICSKADFTGIIFGQVGGLIPTIYYAFYCDWKFQFLYITLILFFASLTLKVTTSTKFVGPNYRNLRTMLLMGLGLSSVVPITHHILEYGIDMAYQTISLKFIIYSTVSLLIGVVIFITHIPECFFPNKFDIIGHSHQFWHLFVLLGTTIHYFGYIEQYHYWHLHHPTCAVN
ncbi:hemolysin-III related-domain-containing protein [Globomyces pollinis-pini]|nr:hemolysin-III related-domain-containing protein [Globomyces pollinis-pini]